MQKRTRTVVVLATMVTLATVTVAILVCVLGFHCRQILLERDRVLAENYVLRMLLDLSCVKELCSEHQGKWFSQDVLSDPMADSFVTSATYPICAISRIESAPHFGKKGFDWIQVRFADGSSYVLGISHYGETFLGPPTHTKVRSIWAYDNAIE